jgi:hypothetical protein
MPENKLKVQELAGSSNEETVVDKPTDSGMTVFLKSFNQQDPQASGQVMSVRVQASDEIGKAL